MDGVSLKVPRGGFYSLLGPSGCGKTTTLRLVAGFETPDSVEVLLDGKVVNGRKPYERNVSTVFQSYALVGGAMEVRAVGAGARRRWRGVRRRTWLGWGRVAAEMLRRRAAAFTSA